MRMGLIALAGLPGSGKSVLARALVQRLPAAILDKDQVRAALFPPEDIEYSSSQDDLVMEAIFQAAAFLLRKGRTVVLDGRLYSRAYQVERLTAFACEVQVPLKLIECVAPDEIIRQRLEADVAEHRHLAQNRSFAMYCRIKAAADPIILPHLVVDTSQPLEDCVSACLEYLNRKKFMPDKLSPSAQKVQDALKALGFANVVIEHEQTTRSAKEAAQAIGCAVGQIVKSLIFVTKDSRKPVLILVSGPNRVNEARMGELLGESLERATPDFAQEVSGYAIGGVPPLGHRSSLLTFIDQDLLQYAEIWAAAGTPHAVFKLTPQEMLRMTGGQAISVI